MGNTHRHSANNHERLENDDEQYFEKIAARNKIKTRDFTITSEYQQLKEENATTSCSSRCDRFTKILNISRKRKKKREGLGPRKNVPRTGLRAQCEMLEQAPTGQISPPPGGPISSKNRIRKKTKKKSGRKPLHLPRDSAPRHVKGFEANKPVKDILALSRSPKRYRIEEDNQDFEETFSAGMIWNEIERGDKVTCLKWHGDKLAIGSEDGFLATGSIGPDGYENVRELSRKGKVRALSWSPDGIYIAVGGDDGSIAVMEYSSLEIFCEIEREDRVYAVEFSPDGRLLAIGGFDGLVAIYVLPAEFRHERQLELIKEIPRMGLVLSLAWSPDGIFLAIGGSDKRASIVGVDTWEVFGEVTRQGSVQCVCWSPSGEILAVGGHDGYLALIDIESQTIRREIGPPEEDRTSVPRRVTDVTWSPDGAFLALVGTDNTCSIIETNSFVVVHQLERSSHATSVDWQDNGKYLAVGGEDKKVALLKTGGMVSDSDSTSVTQRNSSLASVDEASTTSNTISTANSNLPNWIMMDEFKDADKDKSNHDTSIMIIAFSKGAKYLAVSSTNSKVVIINTEDWRPVVVRTFDSPVNMLSWSFESHFLALGIASTLTILSTPSFSPLLTNTLSSPILSLSFTMHAPHLAVGLTDGCLSLLSSSTWSITGELDSYESPIGAVNWSKSLLAVGRRDGMCRLHDIDSVMGNFYVPVVELRRDGSINCLEFSFDGNFLAMGASDHTLAIYHTSRERECTLHYEFRYNESVNIISWSFDGQYLATPNAEKGLIILNSSSFTPVSLPSHTPPLSISFDNTTSFLAIASPAHIQILSPPSFATLRTLTLHEENQYHSATASISEISTQQSNVQSILDDLASAPNISSLKRSSKQTGWSQRPEPIDFLETAEAFLNPYEFEHPTRIIRLFVATMLMLQWHVRWVSSLQDEIRESVVIQDHGEPLTCICQVLAIAIKVMERLMEDEESNWFNYCQVFDMERSDIDRINVWNSWWKQCYNDAPLVDVGLLQKFNDEERGKTPVNGANEIQSTWL